jgi:hypothetical protein
MVDESPKEFLLFRLADDKIEKIKTDMGRINEQMSEIKVRIDRVTDRVDNGVAVTGQKTLEKVMDLVNQVSSLAVDLEKKQQIIMMLSEQVKVIHKWVFWVAFSGVVGGILSFLFKAIP